jgi:hypothetical protein
MYNGKDLFLQKDHTIAVNGNGTENKEYFIVFLVTYKRLRT